MATVRKCDICERIYDEYPTTDETIMMIHSMKKHEWSTSVYGKDEFDCCPECTGKILNFIDILRTYPTRYCIEILSEEE